MTAPGTIEMGELVDKKDFPAEGTIHDVEANEYDAETACLEKRLHRMLVLIVIYVLNYIDRNAIPNARLYGFQTDLGLSDTQYATTLSILYVFYILFQLPSNLLLATIPYPSLYIGGCVVLWGVISTLTGVVKSYGGVVAIRLTLGGVEAVFFPGAIYMLSKWYTRKELALRMSIFYCGSITSNGWGSLIAAGILGHYKKWPYLFYIEGGLTIGIGLLSIWILPGFPETARWLSDEERTLQLSRMKASAGQEVVGDSTVWGGCKAAFADYKTWIMALILTAQVLGLGFATFFPTLVGTLGYNRVKTLLLCAPPWMFACLVALVVGWSADRRQERVMHITGPVLIGVLGAVIAMATMNTAARYFSLFMMASAVAGFTINFSWFANIAGESSPSKRAAVLAITNAFSQLGNIAAGYCWPSKWGLQYRRSFGISLSAFGFAIILAWALSIHLRSENKRLAEEYRRGKDLPEDAQVPPRYFT
ncbi:hypothetical protein V865_005106 [Kwoniella europaea PYCC6329]|uniref:Major facilitator superfamily (MFS) profile domain-containing protein n=1 Tax=Kwoniella europaea PYCC6329 TaxID=1423913 RepID=A0AAX4KLJ6_9TREE